MEAYNKPPLDELSHYGVLGMKWGVRKSGDSSGSDARKMAKADKKWAKKAGSSKSFFAVYNAAAGRMNVEGDRINNKPKYKNKDLNANPSLQKQYHKEYATAFNKILNEEATRISGSSNPSGTQRVRYEFRPEDGDISFHLEDIKHAEGDPYFVGTTNEKGFITSIVMVTGDEDLTQSDILEHFGVKGMKWGVRRDEPSNPNYTSRMRENDRKQHGRRAVRRINKRMNQGESRDKALDREDYRNAYQRLALLGGVFVASMLVDHGSLSVRNLQNYVGNRANENRARARDTTLGISSKATKTPYVKPKRGVYNITTMK